MNNLDISFEFFPPRSDAQVRKFWYTLGTLHTLKPSYISMTWGALGSASQASLDVLEPLVKEYGGKVTAHLSCAGQTRPDMQTMIERLESMGISRFLALRGDARPVEESSPQQGQVLTHASELVGLLAADPRRHISVAAYPECHPESSSAESDLFWLKHKLDAGASKAITQFFFDADTFLRFRDKAKAIGISAKLVPGILPIHDIQKVLDFSEKCGATVPAEVVAQFEKATTPASRFSASVEQCVTMCEKLRCEGVNEFHLYTLNQAPLSFAVASALQGSTEDQMVVAA